MNRFKEARTMIKKVSVATAAKETGLTKSLIEDLELELKPNKKQKPRNAGYLTIAKLAAYYNVSIDWLAGISDSPSISANDKYLTDKVGFTPAAVSKLKAYQYRPARIKALSKLLEQDEFNHILDDISHCAEMGEWETLFEQSFKRFNVEPVEYEKSLIRDDRLKDKTATTYDAQYKLSKICERIIKEAETDGKQQTEKHKGRTAIL